MRTSIGKMSVDLLELVKGVAALDELTQTGVKLTLGFDGSGLKVELTAVAAADLVQVFTPGQASNIAGEVTGVPRVVIKMELMGDDADHERTLVEIKELYNNGPPPTEQDAITLNLRNTCRSTLNHLGISQVTT